jgi:BirA family biotin operon repressor/biotin-[acetyl-CoA-carboxylase] ligase
MNFIYLDEIDSTNNELKKRAAAGAEEGTVLIADRQTAGRGRLGRSFESRSGMGAWVSLLLRPEKAEALESLTCAAAVAVRRTVMAITSLECKIKWTNDIVINGKKLCGILTEYTVSNTGGYVVIGAGLNINQDTDDFAPELREKASSLYLETGIKRECSGIAEAIAKAIYQAYCELGDMRDAYMQEYRASCVTLGRTVEFSVGGKIHRGRALSIGNDGSLDILLDGGELFSLRFGEASVV